MRRDLFPNFLFFACSQLNTDRHIIHGNLLVSIAISQTIFLFGIEQTENEVCKIFTEPLNRFLSTDFTY